MSTHYSTYNYSKDELLICLLARELRNHEVIGVGNNSPVPAAAALLAKAMHAPDATLYILGQPDWALEGTLEFFNLMQRGGMDVFFLSGAQIDPYGNINLHVIGSYNEPKVRLPGGAGAAVVYFMCKRIFLFKTDHNIKGFPEQLDFTSSVASSHSDVHRLSTLEGLFTPLGVFRPEAAESTDTKLKTYLNTDLKPDLKPESKLSRLRLSHTAPGISAKDVQAQTGFDLGLTEEQVPEAAAPSPQELAVLREVVSRQLERIYPVYSRQILG